VSWRDVIRTAAAPSSPARALAPGGWRALAQSASLLLPAWWVWNPGQGGGGSGTVHVDGTTIEGDGSAGNPLHVVPVDYYTTSSPDDFIGTTVDVLNVSGFVASSPLTFSNIMLLVAAADPTETVDVGIYNLAGDLIANIGAQIITAGGLQTLPTLQGAQTIPQGRYMLGVTGTTGGFALYGQQFTGEINWYFSQNFAPATTPGTLNPTIATPPITPIQGSIFMGLY
jgi:hypothetical protein